MFDSHHILFPAPSPGLYCAVLLCLDAAVRRVSLGIHTHSLPLFKESSRHLHGYGISGLLVSQGCLEL